MKKLIIAVMLMGVATFANAAAIGWTMSAGATFAGDQYYFFVIGQKGVTSTSQIAGILDAGNSVDTYAFGGGSIAANGTANVLNSAAGQPTLEAGTYEGFYVVFDAPTPAAGSSKYSMVTTAQNAGLSITFNATKAGINFVGANQSGYLAEGGNWSAYGAAPEPTSGVLLLIGMAGLALKRKRA